jgi:hypothetical protein
MAVEALDVKGKPESYYLPFAHDSLPRAALTAPLCELVRSSHCAMTTGD